MSEPEPQAHYPDLEHRRVREFWRGRLARLGAPRYLSDAVYCEREIGRPATHELAISDASWARVRALGKHLALAEFVIVLSAVAAVLESILGRRSCVATGPLVELEGDRRLDHVVPLVLELDEVVSLRELVLAVRASVRDAYAHQSFDTSALSEPGGPWTDVLVVDDRIHRVVEAAADYPLVLTIRDGAMLELLDRHGRLSAGFVERLAIYLERVFVALAEPQEELARLELIPEGERRWLLDEVNATSQSTLAQRSISACFRDCVQRSGEAIAVIDGALELSYTELADAVTRLASHLVDELGLEPGGRVAVLGDRSAYTVIALLAVLEARGVYVPMVSTIPTSRFEAIAADADLSAVVLPTAELHRLPELGELPALCPELQLPGLTKSGARSGPEPAPEDLAAIVYTSGTDGPPKGVLVEHRGLANVALDHIAELEVVPADRCLLFMAPAFDGAMLDILTALLAGAALVIAGEEQLADVDVLRSLLREREVSVLTMTPSFLALLEPEDFPKLRVVVSAAERARPDDAQRFAASKIFYNGYGPSECSVNATLHRATSGRAYVDVPIGRPRANKQVYVLTADHRLAPRGVIGELGISGVGLARGYLNDPELSARKFIDHPFRPGERLYLSGDRGAWNERGELCFLGRSDRQIKLRGFRVELGEIERRLQAHAALDEVVVEHDGQRILGFVRSDADPSEDELCAWLGHSLPSYMIPARIFVLTSFPRNANGKIDRRALLERGRGAQDQGAAPATEIERRLRAIWAEVLELEQVPVDVDFFRLGGDSIRVIQLVVLARNHGLDLATHEIIAKRTIRGLAAVLSERAPSCLAPDQVDVAGLELTADELASLPNDTEVAYPCSEMQAFMLRRYAEPEARRAGVYHCVATWHMHDPEFSLAALQAAVVALQRRHRCLRTTFFVGPESGRLIQAVRATPAKVGVHDLGELEEAARTDVIAELISADIARAYELGSGECFARFELVARGHERFSLVFSAHHAVIDGWSGVEIENDLFELYAAAKREGELDARAPDVDDYRRFVALERELLEDPSHEAFWRAELAELRLTGLAARDDARVEYGSVLHRSADEVLARLQAVADAREVALKTVALQLVEVTLNERLNLAGVSLGMIVNGRSERLARPLQATGLFWNIVPFLGASSTPSLALGHTRALQRRLDEIEGHARFPLARIIELCSGREPFEVCFNFIHFHNARTMTGGLSLDRFEGHDRFHYPLTVVVAINLDEGSPRLELHVEYRRSHFEPEQIDALIAGFENAAAALELG